MPLGLRTISKITKVIDEEMEAVGGTKLSMPKMLPKELWERTGRWNDMGNELIRLKDRKGEDFCLAPTHEEVITSLVAAGVSSKKHLPLRLYQIGDKYRDEARPRFGLLRGREFIMKDMYSFDATQAEAMSTYQEVRVAYHNIMRRLCIPYAVAEADSGNIGGNLSHEFHALTDVGEDSLLYCKDTGYFANVEKAKSDTAASIPAQYSLPANGPPGEDSLGGYVRACLQSIIIAKPMNATIFKDPAQNGTVFVAFTDATYETNEYLVKGHYKLGASFTSEPLSAANIQEFLVAPTKKVVFDLSFSSKDADKHTKDTVHTLTHILERLNVEATEAHVKVSKVGDKALLDETSENSVEIGKPAKTGESTSSSPVLEERKGIEVGHLFYLGTKYSAPLKANITTTEGTQPIEMGCYGIGVSRLLAVSVETSHDEKGIIWPQSIAPYQVMLIPGKKEAEMATKVWSQLNAVPELSGEVMLDDRYVDSIGYRLKESEFIGIPYAVVLGNKFQSSGLVEVIERKTGKTEQVELSKLGNYFQTNLSSTL